MNKEIKEKWLKALRSGDYKQGIGKLRSKNNEFCCLGVLCDIYSKDTNTPWIEGVTDLSIEGTGTSLVLPDEVMNWAEIDKSLTNTIKIEEGVELTEINDGNKDSNIDKKDFNQIADIIEEKL